MRTLEHPPRTKLAHRAPAPSAAWYVPAIIAVTALPDETSEKQPDQRPTEVTERPGPPRR